MNVLITYEQDCVFVEYDGEKTKLWINNSLLLHAWLKTNETCPMLTVTAPTPVPHPHHRYGQKYKGPSEKMP